MDLTLHSVIWIVGSLLIFILGWIVKGVFFKNNNGTLKKLYDQQFQHRTMMEDYVKNSEKASDRQFEILNKMFELLGKIAYWNEVQAKTHKEDKLTAAIEKLAAKIK